MRGKPQDNNRRARHRRKHQHARNKDHSAKTLRFLAELRRSDAGK